MTKELDTLATALYVKIDDLLRADPGLAPWRPRTGIAPRLADAEVVTLAVLRALLGFTSEARFLRHARVAMCGLFPYLPRQPGCNKRLRALAGTISVLARALARDTSIWADDVWVADSTPVECGRSRDTARRSDLAGWAGYGYCASHSRWFWGLRLHLVTTLHSLPVAFALTRPGADERQVLLAELDDPALARRAGQVIESVNATFKGQLDLERHGGRTPAGVTVRVLQRILALTAAVTGTTTTPASPSGDHCWPTTTDPPWNQASRNSPKPRWAGDGPGACMSNRG